MLFPPLSVLDISFPLESLCKILQGAKELQNFMCKCNHTLMEHSVVPIIAANKLMDIGVGVQKHSWRDVFFTKSPTAQNWFSALFNPLLFSLINLFLLIIWDCYLTHTVKKTACDRDLQT